MMRCYRVRYRTGWTLFLLGFTLMGVLLTYKQMNNKTMKDKYNPQGFYNPQIEVKQELQKEMNFDGNYPQNHQQPEIIHRKHPNLDRINRIVDEPADVLESKRDSVSTIDKSSASDVKVVLRELYPADWGKAPNADEMAVQVKTLLMELDMYSTLPCKDIDSLWISSSVKFGRQKFVDRAYVDRHGREMIIKSQTVDQQLKIKCLQSVYNADKCEVMGNYIILREILAMNVLKHPSIINMKGFCIRGDTIDYNLRKKGVILVLEPGSAVNIEALASYAWKSKILYAIQLADLMVYLEKSPVGSVALNGIRSTDFVLVDKWIKLVDLDDITIDEKSCTTDKECPVTGASMHQIECVSSKCKGRNAIKNMYTFGTALIEPLIRNPPVENKDQVSKLRQKMLHLEISASELLSELNEIKKNLPADAAIPPKKENKNWPGWEDNKLPGQQSHSNEIPVKVIKNHVDYHEPQSQSQYEYNRVRESNFPGTHDYICHNSRVGWGCVMTVHSLSEAKTICDMDPICKAFVVFTSNPEGSTLMTMVAKNSNMAAPVRNMGATLFIKGSPSLGHKGDNSLGYKGDNQKAPTEANIALETPLECYNKNLAKSNEARIAREKRLMAHLGHKGFGDREWKKNMLAQHVVKVTGINKLSLESTFGGRFNVELNGTQTDKRFQRAVFLLEEGPKQYHVAQLMTFKVDRFLGLYHTPPTITWTITANQMKGMSGDKKAKKLMKEQELGNGDLKGILMPAMPYVIKKEEISIPKRDNFAIEVKEFTRQEKLQLEYIFLWYITKAVHPAVHYGYKGHLLQFDGDQAFQDDTDHDLLKYFNHCQFSNVAYKVLACFRCPPVKGKTSENVCKLGQEIVQQMYDAGYLETDLEIGIEEAHTIAKDINRAASAVFKVINTCIKVFSRENVLY